MEVTDNFLPSKVFLELRRHCEVNEFKAAFVGSKPIFVLEPPQILLPYLEIEGHIVVLAFLRCDCKEYAEEINIHADGIINGNKTSLAARVYINKEENVTPNGTCFYKHKVHGTKLPSKVSHKEYSRLLKEDSGDKRRWVQTDCVANIPNRRLLYNSDCFVGREPTNIQSGRRIVLEVYYKKKTP
jgi:hypothetical protein